MLSNEFMETMKQAYGEILESEQDGCAMLVTGADVVGIRDTSGAMVILPFATALRFALELTVLAQLAQDVETYQ